MAVQYPSIQGIVLLILLLPLITIQAQKAVFKVTDFGAKPDNKTDNSAAFLSAWKKACQSKGHSVVWIPPGTFRVQPLTLGGPCSGTIEFQNKGVIVAPADTKSLSLDRWICFERVNNLVISGGGEFDGQGHSAWPYNNCITNPKCKQLPISLRLDFVNNAHITGIKSINSKSFHIDLYTCKNVTIDNVQISAPGDSKNTDGIHISDSNNVHVINTNIGTGDDCVSIGAGCTNINITGVRCGPGHGISIGSLGRTQNEKNVVGVTVRNSSFTNTQNGLRIKTVSPSPAMSVSDITFQDIHMFGASNPIIIDQNYCPHNLGCGKEGLSQVQISDVKFERIQGTSAAKVAVKFDCSKVKPCQRIQLRDINLVHQGKDGAAVSSCANAKGTASGQEKPPSCLSS